MPSIGVYGPSGHGKSTGIRPPGGIGLDPKETFIICPDMKSLPFRGSKVLFPEVFDENGTIDLAKSRFFTKDTAKLADGKIVQRAATNPKVVLGIMKRLEEDKSIKNGVLDTLNHIMTDFFIKRSEEKGYEKFTEMGKAIYDILNFARYSRINWFIIMHNEDSFDIAGALKESKIKTQGKLLDRQVDIPSMFTIMLTPHLVKNDSTGEVKFFFRTQTEGVDITKSPAGMFERIIPNDFGFVLGKIDEYENNPNP
jgi:hypothetical protein